MSPDVLDARSAIEALRSGVPGPKAVAALGTKQSRVQQQFLERLDAVEDGKGSPPLVFDASFGEGKTHLLTYLRHCAEQRGFVTSYLAVGPQAPLGTSTIILKQLATDARAPNRTGRALRELAVDFKTNSESWADLRMWARGAEVNDRFRALLHLYEELHADEEFRVRILEDMEGAPIPKTEISRRLKEIGQAASYDLRGGPRTPALAHDRLRVLARLFRAMSGRGLVVFFDELERVQQFTLKQRLAAYSELAWWESIAVAADSHLLPVFAYARSQEIVERDQRRFHPDQPEGAPVRAAARLLDRTVALVPATREQSADIRYAVADLYQRAYGMAPGEPEARAGTIRSQIRYWITTWDIQRHYPADKPRVEQEDLPSDKREYSDEETDQDEEDAPD